MSKGLWITGGLFLSIILICGVVVGSLGFGYWDFTNTSNKHENGIKAKYKDNQNVYDNGVKKIQETFQVTDAYANKVKEVTIAAIQGRYGENGSQAVFQTLQESNPEMKPEMYVKVQEIIEAFRDDFKQNQTELLSRWQTYNNYLTATRSGTLYNTFAGVLGGKFPRAVNEKDFGIVTSNRTENAFDTKKDEQITLKPAESAPAAPQTANTGKAGKTPPKPRQIPQNLIIPAGGQLPPQPKK